ncbi:MAG: hypothetical protein KDK36_16950, partial [Leptospiraceae bacterium]|nr:hypothetical protein [Leptospiraceae bacterium]
VSKNPNFINKEEFYTRRNGISVPLNEYGEYYYYIESKSLVEELNTKSSIYKLTLLKKTKVKKEEIKNEEKEIVFIPTENLKDNQKLPKKEENISNEKNKEKSNDLKSAIDKPVIKKELQLIYPGNTSIVDMAKLDNLKFSWKKLNGATKYNLNLYNLKSGKQKILNKEIQSNFYILNDLGILDIGNFEWELIAEIEEDGVLVEKRKTAKFKIILSEELDKPDLN